MFGSSASEMLVRSMYEIVYMISAIGTIRIQRLECMGGVDPAEPIRALANRQVQCFLSPRKSERRCEERYIRRHAQPPARAIGIAPGVELMRGPEAALRTLSPEY